MPWMLMPDHSVQQVDEATFQKFFWEVRADHSIVEVARSGDEHIEVSTVFLMMYPPELGFFETLVFGGPLNGYDERYMTWDEAVEGHKRMVERVTLACVQSGYMLGGPHEPRSLEAGEEEASETRIEEEP